MPAETTTETLNEASRRWDDFQGGRPVSLPDGQTWWFYEPEGRVRLDGPGWTFGDNVPSDVDAILTRALERAVLAGRDADLRKEDMAEAVESFIDPLDPDQLVMQELAAVQACSDRRFLPERYRDTPREDIGEALGAAKRRLAHRG